MFELKVFHFIFKNLGRNIFIMKLAKFNYFNGLFEFFKGPPLHYNHFNYSFKDPIKIWRCLVMPIDHSYAKTHLGLLKILSKPCSSELCSSLVV